MAEHDEDIRSVGSTPMSSRSFVGKVAAIQKPFSPATMAQKVRAVLDAAAPYHRAQTMR